MCVCHFDLVYVLCVYSNSSQHHPRPTRDRHSLACLPAAHPQLASCSSRCRAGSRSRALALTPHAHHLPNASCVTGTTRGSLGCVYLCMCAVGASRVCEGGCALPCNTTRIGAQRINPTIRPIRPHHAPLRWRSGSCPRPIASSPSSSHSCLQS